MLRWLTVDPKRVCFVCVEITRTHTHTNGGRIDKEQRPRGKHEHKHKVCKSANVIQRKRKALSSAPSRLFVGCRAAY